ncbi:MAG: EamA family transporter [Pseudomonadota bacterium]|jgi:drug/metabolite transporter (DMT)-like permease|nr:MAG: EamA family transporter [Pseudomonadota bacterium]HEX5600836.1 EamA family transporter [Hyphomicrobiaceae bacterium]
MDPFVFFAVLAAAACHAGWNALLKLKLDPVTTVSLINACCGIVVLPFVFVAQLPELAAWPFLIASVLLHLAYFLSLAEAYRFGDLSHVYPIARGTAPLLTAVGSTFLVGEPLGTLGWLGVILLAGGIMALSIRPRDRSLDAFHGRSVAFALLTSITITSYTLVDGLGARIGPSPAPYIVWLFLLNGIVMAAYGLIRVPAAMVQGAKSSWYMALTGGVLLTSAYAIAIWAMTVAPIALVAALRETSVLFATLIGIVFLREPVYALRIVAGCVVLVGIVLLRLR